MNIDDDARCEEIERRLKAGRKYGDEVEWAIQAASDLRFLLDLARTADAMLRTAFLDHGLDVDAVRKAAIEDCLRVVESARWGGSPIPGVVVVVNAIRQELSKL